MARDRGLLTVFHAGFWLCYWQSSRILAQSQTDVATDIFRYHICNSLIFNDAIA